MCQRALLLAGFAAAWLGITLPGFAQGTIAYYRPDTPIAMFTREFPEFYQMDLDSNGTTDFTFTYSFQFFGVQPGGSNRILTLMSPPPNIGGSVAPLPAGFAIAQGGEIGSVRWYSGAPDYNTLALCFDLGCGGAFVGQHAYMGVEFSRAGSTYYGWLLLNVAADYPAGQLEAWAWETRPGEAILAGAVPEPSTWALLVTAGFLFWWYGRKKRMA